MGHEIAHAVAKHSVERASQAITINLGTVVGDILIGRSRTRTHRLHWYGYISDWNNEPIWKKTRN